MGTGLIQRMANLATEFMGMYGQVEASKWAPLGGSMIENYQLIMGFNIAAGFNGNSEKHHRLGRPGPAPFITGTREESNESRFHIRAGNFA